MLKKIAVTELRLGMHVHALEGHWLDHPFWKTHFLLADARDLDKLRASGVREVWIDSAKGLDVEPAAAAGRGPPEASAAAFAAAPQSRPEPRSASAPPQAPAAMAEEMQRAAAICQRGRAAVMQMFGEARMGRAIDARACLPLVDDITGSVMRNPGALVSLARLKSHNDYSYLHSVAVCALMVALGRQLGFDDERCRQAGFAGLLHDLGKAVMPGAVLDKPGKLTDEEYAVMRTHPERGHALLLEGGAASEEVLDVCLHHHEKIDGSGYPHGLSGEQISLFARMGAVCDVYDAITSNRPYKHGWDPAESIARMASWKGHFDAPIFQAFVRSLGIYPTGALVRMQSQNLAVVVEQHATALTSPVVKIFYSLRSTMPVPPRLVDLARPNCSDRIVGREPAEAWSHVGLDALWAGELASRKR